MADVKRNVRVEERLRIKIGEAKNLPGRNQNAANLRDIFCVLSLDQEEIFRTSTIEKTLNPFFGEEFQFSVPRRFRYLSVYVYDRDKTDKVVGKVAIKREDLQTYHNKDHWFPIRPVNPNTEVQGKAHLEVKFEETVDAGVERLSVRLSECSDLTLSNGCCDPFATIAVHFTNGRMETRRTKVRKKTNCPVFDETLTFELNTNDPRHSMAEWAELVVTLYHDAPGNNVFLGEVRVALSGLQAQTHATNNAWYFLQPHKGVSYLDEGLQSSLRLKIYYTVDHVFPSHKYNDLRRMILQSHTVQPVTSSACYLLGEIIPCKVDAAQPLVRILLHHGQIVPIMRTLAKWEISKVTDANTIFRGNTLVSKMMDEVMRLAGLHYLHDTLRPALDQVFAEKKPCEIDPTRVKDPAVIQTNMENLKEYVQRIFQAITSSALRCPTLMCQMFHDLRQLATSHFPDNKEVRYSVVSGFIFLRFFAPAILGPRLFDLTTEQIDSQTNRTLTLISKTIQSLCNLVSARTPRCNEEYMTCMYQTFYTDTHITAVRQFLEIISATSNPTQRNLDSAVVLKEGMLTKRAQGRKRFGRKNFKARYFRLTTQDLTYSKHKGKEPLCNIPLSDILAVERVQEESFKKNNMFQIVQPQRVLYLQASNCVEEKEWVDVLAKICRTNEHRLDKYHPGAYVSGHWICCKAVSETADGCTQVSSSLDLQMNVDTETELARLHSLIITHMDRLERVMQDCECQAVYTGDICFLPRSVIEDVQSSFKTLTALREAAIVLEQEHRAYLRALARETKYGSKQAPIGDDNYLLLAGRMSCLDNSGLSSLRRPPLPW
ncbi:GTPase-activating protein [Macrosteles quadrilineatus]|uniref:GTPase-activating protein n=1 Tax=Macrosteles quadrilineatus TaxID=74068 RepID=UPI0023E0BA49|nr:GTPase-activating protein [Macrosteles quadrilineatus]